MLPYQAMDLEPAMSSDRTITTDQTMPTGRWQFDEEVTDAFDDMLRRSIPQYETMRRACFELAKHYQISGTDIVDLGCSRGEAIAGLVDCFANENRFVGVEVSGPMLAACRRRFSDEIESGSVSIENLDLRTGYPDCSASVTLAVLTVQFVPIEHRQRLLEDVYAHTIEGGAFIIVEKILGANAQINQMMADAYAALKAEHGYSQEAIERKQLSLEGVLVPVTAQWNEELLAMAGFRCVDCFWRWMNFAGWVAVK